MTDAWFENEIAPDGVKEDGCHPDEAQALKEYLGEEISAEEAARQITKPTEKDPNPGYEIPRLWGLLHNALTDITSAQPKIVTLLQEIQKLPQADLTNKDREPWLREQSEELWRDLPAFGHTWGDTYRWQFAHHDWNRHINEYTPEQWDKVRRDVEKYARIEAQLVAGHVDQIPVDWGYMSICDALERSNAMLDIELPAAKEWFAIAGRLIHDHKVAGNYRSALALERDLWKGNEMTEERWAFWKERLMAIQRDPELKEAIRQVASEALEAMDAAVRK